MLKVIKPNEKYNDNLKKYNKKDGILTLLLFLIVIVLFKSN